jgi:hypothetical protein
MKSWQEIVRRRIKDNFRTLSVRPSFRIFRILNTNFPKGILLVLIVVYNKQCTPKLILTVIPTGQKMCNYSIFEARKKTLINI